MATLSKSEKQELLELARSSQLRHDMRQLKSNQQKLRQNTPHYVDTYIQFLNEMNELIDHKPRKFKKIVGEFFIL